MSITSVTKGIYHECDQRYNLFEVEEQFPDYAARILEQAQSVACLIDKGYLDELNSGYRISASAPTLSAKILRHFRHPLGSDQAFQGEICIGGGTAFLIGKRIALTAGHCVCDEATGHLDNRKIQQWRLVFGFHMSSKNQAKTEFRKTDVYRIDSIIDHRYRKSTNEINDDWAVLKLDREVEGRQSLDITICDDVPMEKRVYMLGHPSGLPLKLAKNGEVERNDEVSNYFEASLDAFQGNSGSPVFIQETGLVAGMLFRGSKDYHVVRNESGEGEVQTSFVTEQEIKDKGYEKCQKIMSLVFLRSILSSIDIPPPVDPDILKRVQPGLSLEAAGIEAICACNQIKSIVISRGFGVFHLSEQCATACCPSCNTKIHPDRVNTMVLSSCQYEIEGVNIKNQSVKGGPYSLSKEIHKNMRFDVRDWHYLELKVAPLGTNAANTGQPAQNAGCIIH